MTEYHVRAMKPGYSTAVWFRGDYNPELETAIWFTLLPLARHGNNCWEYDHRRKAVYALFNLTRKEHAAARLWIEQVFGDDVKVGWQGDRGVPGAHE
jgi:hypothetical protein